MFLGICCLLLGYAGAWLVMKWGDRIGLKDVPNSRSSHTKTVPRCAGFGILFAFILCAIWIKLPLYLWLPVVSVSLVGFLGGDKDFFSVRTRLFCQYSCALFFTFGLFYSMPFDGKKIFMFIPITIFIVGTANFYNFMDGIDGIAGVSGVVAFLLIAFNCWMDNSETSYILLGIGLAFSCVGFLFLNYPKAKVFLGDIGSILLGFVFSCLVVMLSDDFVDFLVLVGCLSVFYWDELLTMGVRIRKGESLVKPHRRHIYQLLANELNVQHWKVSLCYGVIQALVGVSLILLKPLGLPAVVVLYTGYGLLFYVVSAHIRRKASEV